VLGANKNTCVEALIAKAIKSIRYRCRMAQSEAHDGRLEGIRRHFDKHLLWYDAQVEQETLGQINLVGLYLDQAIILRNDMNYNDESAALCHELCHVHLHPEQGSAGGVASQELEREERIVNRASRIICASLGVSYDSFITDWTVPHCVQDGDMAKEELEQSEILAAQLLLLASSVAPASTTWIATDKLYPSIKPDAAQPPFVC
jgi:hypothetical protein